MKKKILFFLLSASIFSHAQTRVVTVTPGGQQRVVALDTVFMKLGVVDFFRGNPSGRVLVNINGRDVVPIWLTTDTIKIANNTNNYVLPFVYYDSLRTLTNEWYQYEFADYYKEDKAFVYTKLDSANIVVGGVNYREYVESTAKAKYKIGFKNSAGQGRRILQDKNYSSNPIVQYVFIERRRWKKSI